MLDGDDEEDGAPWVPVEGEEAKFAKLTAVEKAALRGWYVKKLTRKSVHFRSPFDFFTHGKTDALFFARDCRGSLKEYIERTGKSFSQIVRQSRRGSW